MKAWPDAQLGITRIAVIPSARQFRDPHLVENVASVLHECDFDTSLLELEFTETVMMGDLDDGARKLEKLHALGVSIPIDDFGTGVHPSAIPSAFRFRREDRSIFRGGGPVQADDVVIVQAIIALARTLNLGIIAECVETVEQRRLLSECGCR